MKTICGLCGKPGKVQCHDGIIQNEHAWIAMLHCNRCADFKVALRALREHCKSVMIFRWQLQQTGKMTPELTGEIKEMLIAATKAVAELTARHWRVDTVWDLDFVNQLMEFPDKAEFIVNQYAKMIKDLAAQTHAQATLALRSAND